MFKCQEPGCKFKTKKEPYLKMHWTKIHSIKSPIIYGKKKGRPKKNQLSLYDAIVALKVKRDSFDEVINLLEGLQ